MGNGCKEAMTLAKEIYKLTARGRLLTPFVILSEAKNLETLR
jgi:hypothetical protein